MAKATKSAEKLKQAEERITELNGKIKELVQETEVLKSQLAESTLSQEVQDGMDTAVNVRFDEEEKVYFFDTVAYSANGSATLLSSEPVAGSGFADKIEHAFSMLNKYVQVDVKRRLQAEEKERREVRK